VTLNNSESFEEVKARLDEIVEAVTRDDIPLEDALKLYEEAVELGLAASSLLEQNLEVKNAAYDEEQAADQMAESN
jgi:exodeoxyribonuclease VII small subunit